MFPELTRSWIEGFGIDGICNGKYLDLAFSLLLKVLIDSCFVFSLLQHRVLQLQQEQSNGSNKGPKNVCFLVRTFTKHSRHTWSACELGYFTYVLYIAAFALEKTVDMAGAGLGMRTWACATHGQCLLGMRHSGLPFSLSLSLSLCFLCTCRKGL